MLYLVRHAKAGSRSDWDDDDRIRPLTKPGRRQAEALADRLAAPVAARLADRAIGATTPRLLSSPYVRCIQTLEPLAARLGRAVESVPMLAESQPFEPVLALLDELPDGSVLCSHGDLIPDVIEALLRRGAELEGQPSWAKGSVWTLHRTDGVIDRMNASPPPD